MDEQLRELQKAVEEKTAAEIKRTQIEERALEMERIRLARENNNAEVLGANSERINKLLILVSEKVIPSIEKQSIRIEVILEIVGIISGWLYSQGYKEAERLDALIHNVSQRGDMKVEIKPSGDANIGDIFEGTKYVNIDIAAVINEVCDKVKEDDIEGAENILNSLPKDALDIVLAAVQSKFAVARVIIEKIADKIQLKR